MSNLESLVRHAREKIADEEKCVLEMYRDSKNLWTIGYGWCLERSPMRQSEADFRLDNDVAEEVASCIRSIPGFMGLTETRQVVLVDMTHQMGIAGVLKFKGMLAAVDRHDWAQAAAEMLDSKWAREDSPNRARRNAEMMLSG